MKQETKQKIKDSAVGVTRDILKSLYNTFLDTGRIRPFSGYNYFGTYAPPAKVSRRYYLLSHRATVSRLKKQGWIIAAEKNGKEFLKLTKKGKVQALLYMLEDIGWPDPKRWDGKWRIAMFDIPEKGSVERCRIRAFLKSLGFQQFQKSVYIYPYELPNDAIIYLKQSGLFNYIRFLRVDRLDNDSEIRRNFKLNKHN